MSRYELVPDDPALLLTVGWDPVLATYFAHVLHPGMGRPARDVLLLWVGTAAGQIPTVAGLATHLTAYLRAGLADELRQHLVHEAQRPLAPDVRRRLLTVRGQQTRTQRRQWQGLLGTGGMA